MTDFTVVIPHRDRGTDWRRQANLDSAVRWWRDRGIEPIIVDDGRTGDAQFNRSAAYNRGIMATTTDIIVFSEADLLVPLDQIERGVEMAAERIGLVVPFSRFMAMDEHSTDLVRSRDLHPSAAGALQVRGDRQSIGAVNIVSYESIKAIGGQYDRAFEGAWYDDDAMHRAFEVCCGPTRFVDGPGWHQYHLPGATGDHLTDADRAATEANRRRWLKYRNAKTADQIRQLTRGER